MQLSPAHIPAPAAARIPATKRLRLLALSQAQALVALPPPFPQELLTQPLFQAPLSPTTRSKTSAPLTDYSGASVQAPATSRKSLALLQVAHCSMMRMLQRNAPRLALAPSPPATALGPMAAALVAPAAAPTQAIKPSRLLEQSPAPAQAPSLLPSRLAPSPKLPSPLMPLPPARSWRMP